MTSPISSNFLLYNTIATMAKSMPAMGQTGSDSSSIGSSTSPSTFFAMLMNAMMESIEEKNSTVSQTGAQVSLPTLTTPLTAPLTNSYNPAISIPPLNTKEVPTAATDTSDLKFRPTQFIKLDNTLDGKLSGTAAHFINAGKKYDLDPNLLSAIAIHETGNGSSRAVNDKNNVAGMMGKNGLRSYASVEDSIFDMARNLRQNYLNQGKDTIVKIGAKYAPVGAANDPTGLNNHWTKGVSSQYSKLT
ncbi:Cell wall-associated glycosyl hydrolase [Planococcus halocryophilus Or1]|uniref:Conjugal transfer protein n=2 Tax=Planococcus halocryophilus TaxID=1215089 RepID=A0A1C7DTS7_9BACL|nr:glucosaminidase domain-containing protein [Planococcus halocryophilus]ANU14802.1 conjugal transfer protein [Planococcus halocryophilus]EMF45174.1 Cell wall-associated glycosyl hydrolase [Planococcus halocryophilus Or1]